MNRRDWLRQIGLAALALGIPRLPRARAADAADATLSYRAAGLPPGLRLNATTGVISGTIGVTGGTHSARQTFNWTIS